MEDFIDETHLAKNEKERLKEQYAVDVVMKGRQIDLAEEVEKVEKTLLKTGRKSYLQR
jgi:hypothetical protein